MSDRQRVLLIAWLFPPGRGSGVFRALALANELAALECEVTVLTADRLCWDLYFGSDHDLARRVDPRVSLLEVAFRPVRRNPLINDWPAERVEARRKWLGTLKQEEEAIFPENTYSPWLAPAVEAGLRAHEEMPFDLLLATGAPYVDFEVARQIHDATGVAMVLDDRDSFMFDVFTGEPGAMYDLRLAHFQDYLRQAQEMWFVNEPIAAAHRRAFPDFAERFAVVENGWDGVFLEGLDAAAPAEGRPPSIGFLGTITSAFPMDKVLAGWTHGRSSGDIPADAELRFHGHMGFTSKGLPRIEAEIAKAEGVRYLGPVSKTEVASVYNSLDALLFVKEGGGMVTGGKTYEYVATGKPVAAAAKADSDALRILGGYPRSSVADLDDPQGIGRAIGAALADASDPNGLGGAALEYGAAYARGRQLTPALRRVLSGVGKP